MFLSLLSSIIIIFFLESKVLDKGHKDKYDMISTFK